MAHQGRAPCRCTLEKQAWHSGNCNQCWSKNKSGAHTQLVREHGHDLALLALLQQRVVQDDAHPRQPGEPVPARQQLLLERPGRNQCST